MEFKEKKVGKKAYGILTVLLILSSFLAACNSTSTPIESSVTPNVAADTPTPLVSQPTEVSPEPANIPEEALDVAYQAFLDNMVLPNAITIDALLDRLNEESPPFLLDVRSFSEVVEIGRIDGSVVIPLRDLATEDSIALLPDFDTNIITYCGTGWRCTIAMTLLVSLGWQDVQTLGGDSLAGWIDAGYPMVIDIPTASQLNIAQPDPTMQSWINELLQNLPNGFGSVTPDIVMQAIADLPDLILIDVRSSDEVTENGYLENAVHIPLKSFIHMKERWPESKKAKILVYSNDGHDSTIAMTMLWTYGYIGVASMKGGFNAWVEAGYPVAQINVNE
jgi:rhodanese-related sulfurtransferase